MKQLILFCLLTASAFSAEKKLSTDTTPTGVPYGWVGERPNHPRATVIYLGGAIPENLTQPHYLEGVARLGPEVWCVTLDIPGHGTEALPDEPGGLSTWRHRLEKNTPFLADYTARASSVIDHWVERRFTDPNKIGIFGTSRGGYMAFQLAAADPRIRYIAAFAPVTELLALSEFSGMKDDHPARGASAMRLADALHDRGIWMIIGTTDYRVGTRDTIAFTERLLEAAAAHGFRPRVELHLEPTVGHRVPDGSYPRAADWMLGQFNRGG